MNRSCIIECYYLPCLAYFSFIHNFSKIWLDTGETYIKQSYRNRCYILGANKILPLSVPIHRGSGKVATKDVRIANQSRWQNIHWRSMQSAYGKTPYFPYFADELKGIIFKRHNFLIDLNLQLLTKCLELLHWDLTVDFLPEYPSATKSSQVFDGRSQVMIPETRFTDQQFDPIQYTQAFGKDFVPNLSIIDVLFCEGLQADRIIQRSLVSR